jgi:hypothetical protein
VEILIHVLPAVITFDYESILRFACEEVFEWAKSNATNVNIKWSTSDPTNAKANILEATSLEHEIL